MPLDDRLRAGLHDGAADIEPGVDRHLSTVERRSRRRPGLPTSAFAIAAIVAVALLLGNVAIDRSDPTLPAASSMPVDPADALVGTYRVRLDDPTDVPDASLLGEWELAFDADSGIAVNAPSAFVARSDGPLSGYVYSLSGDLMHTNLLTRQLGHDCAGPGSYRWLDTGGRLTFETVADMCPQREALLTGQAWMRVDD